MRVARVVPQSISRALKHRVTETRVISGRYSQLTADTHRSSGLKRQIIAEHLLMFNGLSYYAFHLTLN